MRPINEGPGGGSDSPALPPGDVPAPQPILPGAPPPPAPAPEPPGDLGHDVLPFQPYELSPKKVPSAKTCPDGQELSESGQCMPGGPALGDFFEKHFGPYLRGGQSEQPALIMTTTPAQTQAPSSGGGLLVILVLVLIGGGAYWYFKIRKGGASGGN